MFLVSLNSLSAVHQRLKLLNRHVGSVRHWAAVRYSASLLKHMVDSLSPYVTQILVNGKMVSNHTYNWTQFHTCKKAIWD